MTAFPRGASACQNERAACEEYALQGQKKHTPRVPAAPVGRTPENTRHTQRCPGLKSRLGLQPASAITPPNTPDQPNRLHSQNP